ncbi:pancreatic lipase-related protein 2-like [Acropora muricata]|uniref:pancreatic lipase-related protein 2-like n=1 Tax=Acropora muricata TaxID=159855 RepID=UPI0034E5437C
MNGIYALILVIWSSFFSFTQSKVVFKEVCYGKYGCFSKAPPFDDRLVMSPQDPSTVNTTFSLYTRSNKHKAHLIDDEDEEKLYDSNFEISKRTIIISHGWTEDGNGHNGWERRMKDALLQREDCNVICIDWAGGAKRLYEQSVGNTRLVGAEIAELVKFIINKNGGSKHLADRFYIIGFSLGGQIAGYAEKSLGDDGMLLGRITGLDPASPYYTDRDPEVRLDPTDAKYVDVIHTNLPIIGTEQRVGHIDFFPNGGSVQPGCFTNKPLDVIFTTSCHHLRAPEYYIATVQNRCSWKAYPCSSYLWFWSGLCNRCYGECPSMGYSADKTKHTGSYFLDTTSKKPFCAAR